MSNSKTKTKPVNNPLKQKIQLGVLGVLLFVALILGSTQLQQSKASPTKSKKVANAAFPAVLTTDTVASAAAAKSENPQSVDSIPVIDLPVTWPTTLRRDPFVWSKLNAPAAQVTLAAPDNHAINAQARAQLKLQGVMLDHNPRVLMNGVLLQLGSQVLGFEIKQIEKRAVIVTRQGVDVRISL